MAFSDMETEIADRDAGRGTHLEKAYPVGPGRTGQEPSEDDPASGRSDANQKMGLEFLRPRGPWTAEFMEMIAIFFFRNSDRRLRAFMGDLEKHMIKATLDHVHGNQKQAARILRLKYTTLNNKIKRYGIDLD